MKIGIVGTGNVGCACAMAAVIRGSAAEIVLVNRTRKTAEAVATDIRYGVPIGNRVNIFDGDFGDLQGADVILITSGVNEKTGEAIDRSDAQSNFVVAKCRRPQGVIEVFELDLSQEEQAGLERIATMLEAALERVSA
jgi:malate/lactate dehydrogenase